MPHKAAAITDAAGRIDLTKFCKILTGLEPDEQPERDYDEILWEEGKWVPSQMRPGLMTLTGLKRLRNTVTLLERVVRENIPGHVLECGVWRGGQVALMAAVMHNLALEGLPGVNDRTIWALDSFEGCPAPDPKYPIDKHDEHWRSKDLLGVSLEQVQDNLMALLPPKVAGRIAFSPGWFEETCPITAGWLAARDQKIAYLRIDGDMYSSTIQVLELLYPHVAKGGFVVVDDYGLLGCRRAVDDFRQTLRPQLTQAGIDFAKSLGADPEALRPKPPELHQIDYTGVWWQKP